MSLGNICYLKLRRVKLVASPIDDTIGIPRFRQPTIKSILLCYAVDSIHNEV